MEEFYIDVKLSQGITRIQVDEVPPEQWDMPFSPQFIIEFYSAKECVTLTIQLEDGRWYDRNNRPSGDNLQLQYGQEAEKDWNLNYQSPLSSVTIQEIGEAIARHMIVHLTAYMALFIPVFRSPALN